MAVRVGWLSFGGTGAAGQGETSTPTTPPSGLRRAGAAGLRQAEDNTVFRFIATRAVSADDLRDHVEQRWPFVPAGPVDPLHVVSSVRPADVRQVASRFEALASYASTALDRSELIQRRSTHPPVCRSRLAGCQ